ncbi:HupE/UreJ family protein [Albimonas sp. CAU 1670]|uniref:HupE/UreJ family protein n=1 Tax=Albimonas sp. CAU 1670 TaxID=3032599 RepID=UPI0023DA468E|nr:HupE/UreJ family protein [Albimonas sp. CAU 1670]MDF2233430.1 HupE/UreJ family protein [Albimonas sp. CAU 1670]
MTRLLPAAFAAVLLASPAFAHAGAGAHGSLGAGLAHPLTGVDHLLAMVAVGLWASQVGGRAIWMMPAAFAAAMAAGYGLALAGVSLPSVEPMIAASVIALGLLAATATRLDAGVGAALAAVFALFHGAAHGAEVGAADAAVFGLGFLASTAALLGVGLGLGRVLASPRVARVLGGLTAAAGLGLAFA